jgi:mRNA-degrading endonuclease YafQ of YafQ-DinJ toxin-antitoxin module
LNGEIEKMNQFSKRTKKNLKNKDKNTSKIKTNFWLHGKIEQNNKFYKRVKKRIINQNNENQIENIIP